MFHFKIEKILETHNLLLYLVLLFCDHRNCTHLRHFLHYEFDQKQRKKKPKRKTTPFSIQK